MTDAVIVREAVLADAEAIGEVDYASHLAAYSPIFGPAYAPRVSLERRHAYWRDALRGEQPRDPHWILVASIGEQVVAYAGLLPSRDADAGSDVGEVATIYVHPDCWRNGLGRLLLNAALDFLAGHGFPVVTLWAMEENHRARSFYEAEGWVDDGARQQLEMDFPEVNLTEVRYRKVIAP